LLRTVVLRYRYELEARRLAPATINLRLAAVRRLAYEASDNGLLSPDLAASIRRVKGAKKLGTRVGNWLTCTQGRRLLEAPDRRLTKGKRDHAILALLLGCGLRRAELIGLKLAHLQQRDDHWAIIDLFGKGGHVRTVPVPAWVKAAVDEWLAVAQIEDGLIFRCVTHSGTVWGSGISEKVVWWAVRQCARKAAIDKVAPHDLRRTCARLCHAAGGELEQIQFLLGIALWRPRSGILAPGSGSCTPSMTNLASSQKLHRAEELTANATSQGFRDNFLFGGYSLGIFLSVNLSSVIDVKNGVFLCGTQRGSRFDGILHDFLFSLRTVCGAFFRLRRPWP
jgi:site-specific recombinase XerD